MSQQYSIQQKISLWQLSFADLLTLLLCFFVALASAGSFKAPVASSATASNSGTRIAKEEVVAAVDPMKPKIKTLWFEAEMFTAESFELTEKSLFELRSILNSDTYEITRVQIATCDSSLNASEAENWDYSMRRMLGIQRQIADMRINRNLLVSRLLGPACQALSEPDKKSLAVSKVQIEYKTKI